MIAAANRGMARIFLTVLKAENFRILQHNRSIPPPPRDKKMASLGRDFSSSRKIFSLEQVTAFLTARDTDASDTECETDAYSSQLPIATTSKALLSTRSTCETSPLKEASPTAEATSSSTPSDQVNVHDGFLDNSVATEAELSILQHQPDVSNFPILSVESMANSDKPSEISDKSDFYASSDDEASQSNTSVKSHCECESVDTDSDESVSSSDQSEVQQTHVGSSRGHVRRCGIAPRRRGRGLGRGRSTHLAQQAPRTPSAQASELPTAAVDISVEDEDFQTAPAFNPKRTPGPHLPPNTEVSAMGLFGLFLTKQSWNG